MDAVRKETLEYLRTCDSALISDACALLGIDCWMDDLLPMQAKVKFSGPIYPAKVGIAAPGEKTYSAYEMIDACPAEHVLVTTGASGKLGMGENLYRCAYNKGITAIVLEAKIRDVDYIYAASMPLLCEGVTARIPKSPFIVVGVGVPVVYRNLKINPGDIAVGDNDGVVVIPQEHLDEVIGLVKKIADIEKECTRLLDENCSPLEILKMMKLKKELQKQG